MEKLLRSNNSLMLNHLPRILNMIQILNMMMYGFVNNQPILFVQAIGSIQKKHPASHECTIKKMAGKAIAGVSSYRLLHAANHSCPIGGIFQLFHR